MKEKDSKSKNFKTGDEKMAKGYLVRVESTCTRGGDCLVEDQEVNTLAEVFLVVEKFANKYMSDPENSFYTIVIVPSSCDY